VTAAWRRALGDDYGWAGPLLVATDDVAESYPKLEDDSASPLAYELVWRDAANDVYCCACPDGTGTVRLRRADLVVYELDLRALAGRLAAALGITPDYGATVDGAPHAVRVGAREPLADDDLSVYLTVASDPADLANTLAGLAATRGAAPFVLLTPTRSAWRAWSDGLRGRGRVLAMRDRRREPAQPRRPAGGPRGRRRRDADPRPSPQAGGFDADDQPLRLDAGADGRQGPTRRRQHGYVGRHLRGALPRSRPAACSPTRTWSPTAVIPSRPTPSTRTR
jgi:hypothetical protein